MRPATMKWWTPKSCTSPPRTWTWRAPPRQHNCKPHRSTTSKHALVAPRTAIAHSRPASRVKALSAALLLAMLATSQTAFGAPRRRHFEPDDLELEDPGILD